MDIEKTAHGKMPTYKVMIGSPTCVVFQLMLHLVASYSLYTLGRSA